MSTKVFTKIAILGALAFILMLFEFPLPVAPNFYKLDLSEVPVLVGGFALGPIAAIVIEALKNVLNIIFTGSTTAYVGEFANFIVGCAFVVPAAIIYKRNKTKSSALKGLIIGTICLVIAGALMNVYVLLPLYSRFMELDKIIEAGNMIFKGVKDVSTFVLFCVVPFNLIKGVIVSAITALVYKRVSPLLHK